MAQISTLALMMGGVAGQALLGGGGGGGDPFFSDLLVVSEFRETVDSGPNNYGISSYGNHTSESGRFSNYAYEGMDSTRSGHRPGLVVRGSNIPLTNEDFTVECWATGTAGGVTRGPVLCASTELGTADLSWLLSYDTTNNKFVFQYSTDGSAYVAGTAEFEFSGGAEANFESGSTWVHIAAVRNGSTITLYVDGVAGGTTLDAGTDSFNTPAINNFGIGNTVSSLLGAESSVFFIGKIDEVRVTVGTARYTAAFTPPADSFPASGTDPNWANVKLLLQFPDRFNVWTVGPVTPSKIRGGGVNDIPLMDTTGDGLNGDSSSDLGALYFPTTNAYDLGSGDFTIEAFGVVTDLFERRATIAGRGRYNAGTSRVWRIEHHFDAGSGVKKFQFIYYEDVTGTETKVDFDTTMVEGTSYDIAVERSGSTLRLYVDGAVDVTTTITATINDVDGSVLGVGAVTSSATSEAQRDSHNGTIKAFRFTKAARYEGAYTVPELPLPVVA